jgi:hypothetical protein
MAANLLFSTKHSMVTPTGSCDCSYVTLIDHVLLAVDMLPDTGQQKPKYGEKSACLRHCAILPTLNS